jgi:transposase
VQLDGDLEVLRMLVEHRDALSRRRVQTVNRLHALLAELVPGQAKKDITASQATGMLASVRPRDVAGKTCRPRRRGAVRAGRGGRRDQEVHRRAQGPGPRSRLGPDGAARGGPVVAARVLADVGDVARFADRDRFASWTGTAPLDASSGEHDRHRLSRAGNRRVNHVIHIAAVTQLRLDTDGPTYHRRKRTEGKRPLEAIRFLRRRISDAIYRQLVADAAVAPIEGANAGPGAHCGASQLSSAAAPIPRIEGSRRDCEDRQGSLMVLGCGW